MKQFVISPSPHIHSGDSVRKNMYQVLLALLPAFFVSALFFGWDTWIVTTISVLCCVLTEFLIQRYLMKVPTTITDGSAVLTGVLLAFNLPGSLPWWIILLGAIFAIGVGKMSFGGLGNNIFNPALVGRVFLLISFPVQMTSWPKPKMFNWSGIDAGTGATPLEMVKQAAKHGNVQEVTDNIGLIFKMIGGDIGGSLGEVSALALLLGGGYLIWRKVITWHIPVAILATVIVFASVLYFYDPSSYVDPFFHIFSGGLILGAIFMATDYATSPMTYKGMLIYGVGIGVITVLIRVFGAYPEGVSFAILIMNAVTPLINVYMKPKRFSKPLKTT